MPSGLLSKLGDIFKHNSPAPSEAPKHPSTSSPFLDSILALQTRVEKIFTQLKARGFPVDSAQEHFSATVHAVLRRLRPVLLKDSSLSLRIKQALFAAMTRVTTYAGYVELREPFEEDVQKFTEAVEMFTGKMQKIANELTQVAPTQTKPEKKVEIPADEISGGISIRDIVQGTYTKNADGSFSVVGNVNLVDKGITKIPFVFADVSGEFNCSKNQLTSLYNSPRSCGALVARYCDLKSLNGCSARVGYLDVSHNALEHLIGFPKVVERKINLSFNRLTSLKGFSLKETPSSVYVNNNPLISQKGGPKIVHGDWYVFDCKLGNLVGGPETVDGDYKCQRNPLESEDGKATTIGGEFVS